MSSFTSERKWQGEEANNFFADCEAIIAFRKDGSTKTLIPEDHLEQLQNYPSALGAVALRLYWINHGEEIMAWFLEQFSGLVNKQPEESKHGDH